MRCLQCHTENKAGRKFCAACRQALALACPTPLSEQLDPEDLREVVRAYQQTCAEVIQRFDGHIAQLLGSARRQNA